MKKLFILLLIVLYNVPAYSGCWRVDTHKILFTGGIGCGSWGGTAAYGDSILYYLEHPLVQDTILHDSQMGALFWRTTDAAKTFELFAGNIHNNPVYETDTIADGYWGASLLNMRKIVILDANKIYVAGENEVLLYSDNAGKSWDGIKVIPSLPYNGMLRNARTFNDFDTDSTGLGVMCFEQIRVPHGAEHLYDTIALTTDGWKTSKWVNISNGGTRVYVAKLCIADSNTIYLTGNTRINNRDCPLVGKSIDKGLTWTYNLFTQFGSNWAYFQAIDFISKDVGWIAGFEEIGNTYHCIIYKTIDGGLTWVRQMHENHFSSRGIQKIQFANDSVGYALAKCGGFAESGNKSDIVAFRTIDGGNTWNRIYQDTLGTAHSTAVDLVVGSPTTAYIIVGWFLFKYVDNCESSGIEERLPPMPEELKSFPNPIGSNRSAKLQLGNTYGDVLEGVYLYDSRGMNASAHISYTMTSNGELNFKLDSDLASGTYIVTVQFGTNRIKYCKVIVE